MVEKFEVGDVVQLKSGGPNMTINAIRRDNENSIARCVWIINDIPYFSEFDLRCLKGK